MFNIFFPIPFCLIVSTPSSIFLRVRPFSLWWWSPGCAGSIPNPVSSFLLPLCCILSSFLSLPILPRVPILNKYLFYIPQFLFQIPFITYHLCHVTWEVIKGFSDREKMICDEQYLEEELRNVEKSRIYFGNHKNSPSSLHAQRLRPFRTLCCCFLYRVAQYWDFFWDLTSIQNFFVTLLQQTSF